MIRRLLGRLSALAVGVSMVVFVATVVLWVRSYWVVSYASRYVAEGRKEAAISGAKLFIYWERNANYIIRERVHWLVGERPRGEDDPRREQLPGAFGFGLDRH